MSSQPRPHTLHPSTAHAKTVEITFNPPDISHEARSGRFQLNEDGRLHLPTIARFFSIDASGLMLNGIVPAADSLTGLTLDSYDSSHSNQPPSPPLIATGPVMKPTMDSQAWPAPAPSSSPPPPLKVLLVMTSSSSSIEQEVKEEEEREGEKVKVKDPAEPETKRMKISDGSGSGGRGLSSVNLGLWTPPSISPSSSSSLLQHLQSRLDELFKAKQKEGGPSISLNGCDIDASRPPSSWSLSYPFYGESLPLSTNDQLSEALDHFSTLVESQGIHSAMMQCRIYCKPHHHHHHHHHHSNNDHLIEAGQERAQAVMTIDQTLTRPASNSALNTTAATAPAKIKVEPQLDMSRHLAHLPVVTSQPMMHTLDQSVADDKASEDGTAPQSSDQLHHHHVNKSASDSSLAGRGEANKSTAAPLNASAAAATFLVQLILHQQRQKQLKEAQALIPPPPPPSTLRSNPLLPAAHVKAELSSSSAPQASTHRGQGGSEEGGGVKKEAGYSAKTRYPDGRFKDQDRHSAKIEDMQCRIDDLFEGSIRGLVTAMDHKRFLCKACQSRPNSTKDHHDQLSLRGGSGASSAGGPTVVTAYSAYHIDAVRKHFLRHHEDLLLTSGVNVEAWRKGYEAKGSNKVPRSSSSLHLQSKTSPPPPPGSSSLGLPHSDQPYGQGGGGGQGRVHLPSLLGPLTFPHHYYPPTHHPHHLAPNPLDQLYLSSYLPSSMSNNIITASTAFPSSTTVSNNVVTTAFPSWPTHPPPHPPSHPPHPASSDRYPLQHQPPSSSSHFLDQVLLNSYAPNHHDPTHPLAGDLNDDEEMELMSWLAAEEEASLGSGGGGGSGGGSGGTEGQDTLPGLFDRLHARACETVVPPPPVLSRASDHPTTLLGLDGSSNLPTADDETLDLVSQLYFSSYSSVPPQAVGRGLGTGGSGSDLLSFQQSTGQGSVPANTLIDEIYRAKYSKGGMEKRGGESRQREEERGELLLMGEPMEEDSHLLHSL